jgi:excisionase family DNA binding protein
VYGGAYVFGRTGSRTTLENGRKRVVRGFRKARDEWEVLLLDHHEGYLSWTEYERNQRLIADNANGTSFMARGAVRRGEMLLAGRIRCGHCGRKLHVAYSGTKGDVGRYHCRGALLNHGTEPCISFGSLRVDLAVGAEIIRVLQPLGIEAVIQAIETQRDDAGEQHRQTVLALDQARYEAAHARRQYDAVDPGNRLVAGELERRWNDALCQVRDLEEQLDKLAKQQPTRLSDDERQALMRLGTDLEAAWHHPGATTVTRKRIVRTVLNEIVAQVEDDQIHLVLHWQGGDHTELRVKKNRTGQHRWTIDSETKALVKGLARMMPDPAIAALLNRAGKKTGRQNNWTRSRVTSFRSSHGIAVYRDGERVERGEITLKEAADLLKISPMSVHRLIQAGMLPAEQICKGAPWVIKRTDIENQGVIDAAKAKRKRPLPENPDQKVLAL